MPTKTQSLKKLELLVKQLHDHCEKAGLQYYLCHEAQDHQVLIAGRGSDALMVNIACDLALNHPGSVVRARDIVAKIQSPKPQKEESRIIKLS